MKPPVEDQVYKVPFTLNGLLSIEATDPADAEQIAYALLNPTVPGIENYIRVAIAVELGTPICATDT